MLYALGWISLDVSFTTAWRFLDIASNLCCHKLTCNNKISLKPTLQSCIKLLI